MEAMKWLEGTWSSAQWAEWAASAPWDFPYDQEAYADALGQNWGALVGKDFALPMAYRTKMGLGTAYIPFGMQQWGPIGTGANDSKRLHSAIALIPGQFNKVDIRLHRPSDWQSKSEKWRLQGLRLERWSEKPNYVLDIRGSYENIYKGFNKQTIRNLKASQKKSFTLFEHDTPDILLQAFAQYQAGRYKIPEGFSPAMRSAMYHLLHKGRGAVWSLYAEGNRFMAGVFIAFSGNRAILLFSAISDEGREQKAMTHLVNEVLMYVAGRWEIFDFEGSEAEGLARFYAGFGAQNAPYLRYQRWGLR